MAYDPSEFESSDEHVDEDYLDYLDEFHPPLNEDDLNELESLECDYIFVDQTSDFQELNFDNDIPI
jgi:hypothetical protein